MFIPAKSPVSLTMPYLYDKWDIKQWYCIKPQHLIFLASDPKSTLQKVIEVIPDQHFPKKKWNVLSHLSDRTLLLPEKITSHNGVHILEFYDQLPLKQLILRNGISLSLILQLISEISDSLDTLHQANLLHMDISPGNIFYTDEGHFILGDFSETCFFNAVPFPIQRQTHPLLPPECQKEPPDVKSEQYNLGLLFYLLCNDGCYPSNHLQDIIVEDLALFRCMPDIKDRLNAILTKMLDPDPARRYPNFASLRNDLEKLQTELPENRPYLLHITDESHPFHQTITTPISSSKHLKSGLPQKILHKRRIIVFALLLLAGLSILIFSSRILNHLTKSKQRLTYNTAPSFSANTSAGAIAVPTEPHWDTDDIFDIANQQCSTLSDTNLETSHFTDIHILFAENNCFRNAEEFSVFPNLREAYLSGNQLQEISAFSSLTKLKVLVLSDNLCTDLTGLSQLQQLQFLDLSGNEQLSDVSALANLTQLQTLLLTDTSVTETAIHQLQTALPYCEIIHS